MKQDTHFEAWQSTEMSPKQSREHQMLHSIPSRSHYFCFLQTEYIQHSALKAVILWAFLSLITIPLRKILALLYHLPVTLFLYSNHPNIVGPLLYREPLACQRGRARAHLVPSSSVSALHFPYVLKGAKWDRVGEVDMSDSPCACLCVHLCVQQTPLLLAFIII